jgi:phospholipase/carboxylesterase
MPPNSPTANAPPPHGGEPVVTAGAPRGATEVIVLALHGRGATGQAIVNLLDPAYRHGVTFLAPDAHRSRWYPHAPTAPRERNEPDIFSAVAVVDALAAHATRAFGVGHEGVVLTGISQGAAVAAEYAPANPRRYGGVALLSGAAIEPDTARADRTDGGFAGTSASLASGQDDSYVPTEHVYATADAFARRGAGVTERVYEDTGHEVTDDEFDQIRVLLDDCFPDSQ